MAELTHTDSSGKAKMVDVSQKEITLRKATARATVIMQPDTLQAITDNKMKKGDVLAVAKIAGIQAAKKTAELIPLCHNIFIDNVDIDFQINKDKSSISITTRAVTSHKTGIEMEALTAVSVAGLTIYDMCKAIDKSIIITNIELLEKSGGKSGTYKKSEQEK